MESIRKAGRNTSGVIIVNVEKGDKVVSIAKCPKENDDEVELDENGIAVNGETSSENNSETPSENTETNNNIDDQPSLIDNEENE